MSFTYLHISELIGRLTMIQERYGDTVVLYERLVWGSLALHAKSELEGTHKCDLKPSTRDEYKARAVELITDAVAEKGYCIVECSFLYDHFSQIYEGGNVAQAAEELAQAADLMWSFIDDRTRVQYNKSRF
ncbi:MAG TPA: hypothetical protein VF717_09480 [Pyrinomonadaceae bacterium]|jgi:hypothetical protein